MYGFKSIAFLLPLLVYVQVTTAGQCIPGVVPNLTFTKNALTWREALNPSECSIMKYIIYVFDEEDGSQYLYQVSFTMNIFNIPNLDMCKAYSFEVHAMTSQNVLGPSLRINATTPPENNLNLALQLNKISLTNDTGITLTWNPVNSEARRCISYYRVVYWDENNDPIDNYVTSNNFTLKDNVVACMEYSFQVNAVIENPDMVGPLAQTNWTRSASVASPPKLVSMITTNHSVNMTWKVNTYNENRCSLTALVVETLGVPAANNTIRITIQDSALRPDIGVYLDNLTPNTVYTSFVSLQNVAGYSKNVTVNFQTSDGFVFNYETDLLY